MKYLLAYLFALTSIFALAQPPNKTKNIFIVTIDGIRWQEIFKGADEGILNQERFTSDIGLAKLMYFDSTLEQSRRKLLPFFWNVIVKQGQLFGNRSYNNEVNVANFYKFSYPGYNEIFTGYPDLDVNSNAPINNLNQNVLEYLNSLDEFKNKVVAFTSWNIFPYILSKQRSGFPIYSGYDSIDENGNPDLHIFNKAQENLITEKTGTRLDELTFMAAKEYINITKPKVVFIGLGECDEDAHHGEYDKYLQHLNEADKILQELWYYIQTTPEYKDKTTLIITTDHGRGKRKWTDHDMLIRGSGDAWLAIIGPDTLPEGEIQSAQKIYQKQIAATISKFLGYNFTANHPVASPIVFANSH